jgi:hypothetical protein
MKFIENSDSDYTITNIKSDVYLFQQFFIHKDPKRYKEIKYCLKKNVNNQLIDKIYLLNERIYTSDELGICSSKIIQIEIGSRLMYSDIIHYIDIIKKDYERTPFYCMIANADIFFDDSLKELKIIDLKNYKKVFCQLRYEFEGDIDKVKIFGPRFDSQDAWIYHSEHNDLLWKHYKAFKFQLGQAGCDNHITYLFKILGFGIINNPMLIHCIHFHKTQIREYKQSDCIKPPYLFINPVGCDSYKSDVDFNDNKKLYDYIKLKIENNEKFIIPRVAGVESNTAYLKSILSARVDVMKNNAGIYLTNQKSVEKYSEHYFKAFKNCQMFFGWEKNGEVYRGIAASQEWTKNQICSDNTQMIWACALDIFHYIYSIPWTLSLKGKRILIVSAFIDSIEKKIENRKNIYGIDLFPDCTFEFIRPPMTQGTIHSEEWDIELKKFTDRLDEMRDLYDVALVSSGGYGNLICNYIFEEHNKSAIYVGGVLQMYFGISGGRWFNERASVMRMFLNSDWSRPMESERPTGYQGIEKSCYW